jgi:hypothetical protein
MVVPVTNELSSLARNSMARATSSGAACRASGMSCSKSVAARSRSAPWPRRPRCCCLVLFGLQEALSSYGAWYLVIVGGLAVAATLVSPRGLWGFAADRFGWSLLPVGYRVRPPRG